MSLSRQETVDRLRAGDILYTGMHTVFVGTPVVGEALEEYATVRGWWFENPYAEVAESVVRGLSPEVEIEPMETDLFGDPSGSQKWRAKA